MPFFQRFVYHSRHPISRPSLDKHPTLHFLKRNMSSSEAISQCLQMSQASSDLLLLEDLFMFIENDRSWYRIGKDCLLRYL